MSAFDDKSSSLIRLNNGTILYLREINRFLALVCILRDYNFTRQGIIDYNFLCFRDAIHKIFSVRLSKKSVLDNETIVDYDEDTDNTIDYLDCKDNSVNNHHRQLDEQNTNSKYLLY